MPYVLLSSTFFEKALFPRIIADSSRIILTVLLSLKVRIQEKENSMDKKKGIQCIAPFSLQIEEFLNTLRKANLSDTTIARYRSFCIKLFNDFMQQGVNDWAEIDHRALSNAFTRSRNKAEFVMVSRRLFKYLLSQKLIPYDYSGILPVVKKPQTIPSVYSPAELKKLFDSIETITPCGKRDYAILQLAAKLGIRASDICLLQYQNIDFDENVLRFTQKKTSVRQILPMPSDVVNALRDYINNGRIKSDEQFLFLNNKGKPLHSPDIAAIATKWFKESKIDIKGRHHGPHALRMSFASQLVAENVPYEIVRVALGHVHRDTTLHYVEFAIESLRKCSLESPEPKGLLKKYLDNNGGNTNGLRF